MLFRYLIKALWVYRYDVAFDTNVLGAKHMYAFANKCIKLKMLLHISTGANRRILLVCSVFNYLL